MIPYIGIAISLTISFLIGYKTRKFVYLFLDILTGLLIGVASAYLYLVMTPPTQAGLGIIALVPVIFILFAFFNIISALIGGVIGTLIGRKQLKEIKN